MDKLGFMGLQRFVGSYLKVRAWYSYGLTGQLVDVPYFISLELLRWNSIIVIVCDLILSNNEPQTVI